MSKERIPTRELLSLLEFFSAPSEAVTYEQLASSLDEFLKMYYQTAPMFVFSYPENVDELELSIFQTYRSLLHREEIGECYSQAHVDQILKSLDSSSEVETGFKTFSIEDENYVLFSVGKKNGQIYCIFFKTSHKHPMRAEIINYIERYSRKFFSQAVIWEKLSQEHSLIHIDDVTGLYNQRKLLKDLDESIERYNSLGKSFVVLFIDIDHFKLVNDEHGHLVGTKVLKELGKLFLQKMREADNVYRYGGDEFVVLVPDSNATYARQIGNRILNSVKNHTFHLEEVENFTLSVSIGIASYPKDASCSKDILALADKMMYGAKEAGRGCVKLACDMIHDYEEDKKCNS